MRLVTSTIKPQPHGRVIITYSSARVCAVTVRTRPNETCPASTKAFPLPLGYIQTEQHNQDFLFLDDNLFSAWKQTGKVQHVPFSQHSLRTELAVSMCMGMALLRAHLKSPPGNLRVVLECMSQNLFYRTHPARRLENSFQEVYCAVYHLYHTIFISMQSL